MPRKRATEYRTKEYARARRELLRDNPVCHWCRIAPGVEADHLIELDRGGHPSDMENLVPACKQCNATRGARYKAAKNKNQRNTKQKIKNTRENKTPIKKIQTNEKEQTLFGQGQPLTPRPSLSISPKTENNGKRYGHDLPRLETISRDSAGSFGPLVVAWAKRVLDIEMMPWQAHVLNGQLAYGPDGKFLNRVSLVSVARQAGKTTCLKALLGWWITDYAEMLGRPQTVLSTGHNLPLAVSLFQELAPVLETNFGAVAKWSYGRNELTVNKSRWLVRAATPAAGHGASIDLLLADEIWDISSDALDIGLLPTQRARPNPLASFWSTAGTENSAAFLRWRSQGLRAIDENKTNGLYFAEYSPPPDLDPMTLEAWQFANPSLGYMIDENVLFNEAASPNRAGFLRSSVNLWIQTDLGWLNPGVWQNLVTDVKPVAGGVLACETSLDNGRYFGLRAVQNPDGKIIATVSFVCDTQTELWAHVKREAAASPLLQLALSPTLDVNCPPELVRRRVVVGFAEIARYTPVVKLLINEGRLLHTGEQMLAEHVGRAVAVRTQSSVALSSQRSPGEICLARCLVWAVAMVSRPSHNVTRPMIATSSQRRIA